YRPTTVASSPSAPHPFFLFLLNAPAPTALSTLSLHDALPISRRRFRPRRPERQHAGAGRPGEQQGRRNDFELVDEHGFSDSFRRSEEHTSELQSLTNLVCRLLLEKKKKLHALFLIHHSPYALT